MEVWEQRWHPFRGEWVLFTSHRAGRPWLGETTRVAVDEVPAHDPSCALCPRNTRLSGLVNDDYDGAWWFTNDLPTFGPDAPPPSSPSSSSSHSSSSSPSSSSPSSGDGLYRARRAGGTAEVVCYHPSHARSTADLTMPEIGAVVDVFAERSTVLAARDDVNGVLVFENRGAAVGTSNPHPHAQIYAGEMIYGFFEREWIVATEHHADTGRHLIADVVDREERGGRIVAERGAFVACIPWFARYAYEVHVLPRRPVGQLADLTSDERADLAAVWSMLVGGYDALWERPMPYVMAVHQAPSDGRPTGHYPFHLEFHPPLRTPDTMKYLAGPEIGGGSMTNESDPDVKAAELRAAVVRAGTQPR